MNKTLYFIIPIAIISTLAWFGLKEQPTEKEVIVVQKKVKTELELIQDIKDNKKQMVYNIDTIEKCRESLIPTTLSETNLTEVFSLYQKQPKKIKNCRTIYLELFREGKIAKIKQSQKYQPIKPIDIPETLNIDYIDEETRTIRLFELTDNSKKWNLDFLNKYTDRYNVEKYAIKSNTNLLEDTFKFHFEEHINTILDKNFSYYSDDISELSKFPIQHITVDFKGTTDIYKLYAIKLENSDWWLTYRTFDLPMQYGRDLMILGDFHSKQYRNNDNHIVIEIKEKGSFKIKDIEDNNAILYQLSKKGE